jgi:hypothetical protein
MSEKPVLQKLLLKPGARAAVLGAPPSYETVLQQLPPNVDLSRQLNGSFDFIHAFVTQRDALLRDGPTFRAALNPNGVLWVSYPKGKAIPTDLNRDIVRETVQQVGLDTVSQVAIDETWSALRLKPSSS